MKPLFPLLALAVATLAASAPAAAQDNDPWVLRLGVHVVDPKSGNGHLAGMKTSVDSSTRPSISLEYMAAPNWGIEVLGALPFKHEVKLAGQKAATTKQLPPVLGVNYHFAPNSVVSPFVGVGVNYTYFYDSKGKGLLDGQKVDLDNSWGIAGHAGVDFKLNDKWLITADVRYINIDSDVHVNGSKVGSAHIDPWVYGVSFGYRF